LGLPYARVATVAKVFDARRDFYDAVGCSMGTRTTRVGSMKDMAERARRHANDVAPTVKRQA